MDGRGGGAEATEHTTKKEKKNKQNESENSGVDNGGSERRIIGALVKLSN